MTDMRAAIMTHPLLEPGAKPCLEVTTVKRPLIEDPHDVIIKVIAAGLCQTDLHLIQGGAVDGVRPTRGMALGHETAGQVMEVGSDVTQVEPGDFVLCYPFLPIEDQPTPTNKPPSSGRDRRTPGISQNGGFAEFMRTDDRSLVRVADAQECRELVALTDAGLAAYKAVVRASLHLTPGGGTAVIGLGGLGHLAIQMGRSMGMSPLWGVDPRPDAFKLAKQQGFRDVFVSGEELREFLQRTRLSCDVVIDFVGANDTAQLALDILAYGGLYECVGVAGSITVTTQQLVERDITLQGSLVGSFEDLVNVIALFQSSDCVVTTKEFALEDINSALQALHEGKTFGRIILIP